MLWPLVGGGSRAEPASALAPSVDAVVPYDARQALALDDDQERKGRLLLRREGAVLAHRLARSLAAESDDLR